MKRTVTKQTVITYSIPESEIIEMIKNHAVDEEKRPLLPGAMEINGCPESIEFVYVYPDEENHSER